MHIPSGTTLEKDVLTFEEALNTEGDSYDKSRWLYVPPFYCDYRYILGTKGINPLICIGINPSTASPDSLDPTLKNAQRIALSNGFDSFIMFNVYSQRATRPKDMEKELNPLMHAENMKAFRYILENVNGTPSIWSAWGNIIEERGYLFSCLEDMIKIGEQYGARWFSAGQISKKGHPHHPLYLKGDTPLDPFDIKEYLKTKKDV